MVSVCNYKKNIGDKIKGGRGRTDLLYIYIYIYNKKINKKKLVPSLTAINHIQKNVFVHSMCAFTVYIYYVYINTHPCMYIFKIKFTFTGTSKKK